MARRPHSPAPPGHDPDEIDASTVPVAPDWLADRPAATGAPGRLVLTERALDYLVGVLAGQRGADLPENVSPAPEDLSPVGMVALLDAAWTREQPWRELAETRLRESERPHRTFQQHLYELQDRWNHIWVGRHGDYMAWLTDGAVTDQVLERWEDWMNEEAEVASLREVNPGRLDVEQLAQITADAIQRLARHPGDRLLDDVVEDVIAEVKAAAAAAPPRPEAADPQVAPADVVTDVVDEYLVARQGWGWPAGRASAWAVGQVVDRARTLGMAAVAREESFSAAAAQAQWNLEQRTRAARMAWEADDSQPWLGADVSGVTATAPPQDRIPTQLVEHARTMRTGDLLAWVNAARHPPERPLLLEFSVASDAADQAKHHLDEEQAVLQGLWRQLEKAAPWWWPSTWQRRTELRARIAERARVVMTLQQRFDEADQQVLQSLPGKQQAADKAREAQRRHVLERAAAAAQELQLREQGLLDDRLVNPPQHLLQAFGPRPSDAAGRQAWKTKALQLERTRTTARAIDRAATRTSPGVAPSEDLQPARSTPQTNQMARPTLDPNGPSDGHVRLHRWDSLTKAANPPNECRQIRAGGSRRIRPWHDATSAAVGSWPSTSGMNCGGPSEAAGLAWLLLPPPS